jgi:hypothetical protein
VLAATAVAARTEPVTPLPTPLAHSALVTLEGATLPDALILRVRANAETAPTAVSEFSVALDGRQLPATPRADGSWRVALPPRSGAAAGKLDVTVTHDGVRELLSARIELPGSAPQASPAAGTGVHKQIVWWILNVAIVLIAALAISRRMS